MRETRIYKNIEMHPIESRTPLLSTLGEEFHKIVGNLHTYRCWEIDPIKDFPILPITKRIGKMFVEMGYFFEGFHTNYTPWNGIITFLPGLSIEEEFEKIKEFLDEHVIPRLDPKNHELMIDKWNRIWTYSRKDAFD